eukprot:TRINITY_DN39349_c0_g1_i1.p1 TRINITY_DN39349_c0_g1~~TRINITY_DN39349_c0_g1_i1.p1  ORF type:complete len:458 (-),score=99.21 TRINITY_DN39349_c0_g1_i1:388-1761(-)
MDPEAKQKVIQEFCSIAGLPPDQAEFYLESSSWNVDAAVSAFYDNVGLDDQPQSADEQAAMAGDEEDGEEFSNHRGGYTAPDEVNAAVAPRGSGPATGAARSRTGKEPSRGGGGGRTNSKVRTLGDLGKRDEDEDEDDEDEGDEPNEYYTGGEKSGMMVQDPKKKKNPDVVDAIFERARQHGAREGSSDPDEEKEEPGKRSRGAFSGRSHTTGAASSSANADVAEQGQGGREGGTSGAEPPAKPKPSKHKITFWQNGFTIDDGPLRRLDDPANASFLQAINRGEVPRELRVAIDAQLAAQEVPAGSAPIPVDVHLVKKDEEWKAPPKPRYVAFGGQGQTLSGEPSAQAPPPSSSSAGPAASVTAANIKPNKGLEVDATKPVTSIQLRLADGTRMVARFNHTHTVADIRAFIDAARPSGGATPAPYSLQLMGFPPKPLTDLTATLEGAGLLNSVVVQR